jgi:hypothetical protein
METAAVLVLEPIFEADLSPEQYAYRRDRGALDAVREVQELIKCGKWIEPHRTTVGNSGVFRVHVIVDDSALLIREHH